MKTITQPAVITPTIIGLAILFAAITFIGVTGKKFPCSPTSAWTSSCSSSSA
jgi:hypothetical protein